MAADRDGNCTPYPKTFAPPKAPKPLRSAPKRRTTFEQRVLARILERDGGCLLADLAPDSPCFGRPTPHHRRKGGQGGGYTFENLMVLCQHHNDELEADADLAEWAVRHGVVLRRGDDPGVLVSGCPLTCSTDHRAQGANRKDIA